MSNAAVFVLGFVSGIATLITVLSWAAWSAFKPTPKDKRPSRVNGLTAEYVHMNRN